MSALVSPDKERCQCIITPAHGAFRLGPKPLPGQCENKPSFIVTEAEIGADGKQGSMSVCDACLVELQAQSNTGKAPNFTMEVVK